MLKKKLLVLLFLFFGLNATTYAQSGELNDFLVKKGYLAVKLTKLLTGHLYLFGELNGVKGKFILDSGAGATVIDEKVKDKFKLNTGDGAGVKAAGAGGSNLSAKMSMNNKIVLGPYNHDKFMVAVMDLDHVNVALKSVGIEPFDGVVGADILSSGKAIIDYPNMILYLQQ